MAPVFLHYKQAIRRVRGHVQQILRQLPQDRPLHEIPFEEILRTTHRVLTNHKDFEVKGCIAPRKITPKNGSGPHRQYSEYEIGHQIYCQLVLSQLRADGLLPAQHVRLAERVLGDLWYNPPKNIYRDQLKALDELVQNIGEEKAEKLLQEARFVLSNHRDRHFKAQRLAKQVAEREGTQVEWTGIGDMFANSATNHTLAHPEKGETQIEVMRQKLRKNIETRQNDYYRE